MTQTVLITGNTFPVKDSLRAMGGKWNATAKGWEVPVEQEAAARSLVSGAANKPSAPKAPFVYHSCRVCGLKASRYVRIYRSGECSGCYEERKMGY